MLCVVFFFRSVYSDLPFFPAFVDVLFLILGIISSRSTTSLEHKLIQWRALFSLLSSLQFSVHSSAVFCLPLLFVAGLFRGHRLIYASWYACCENMQTHNEWRKMKKKHTTTAIKPGDFLPDFHADFFPFLLIFTKHLCIYNTQHYVITHFNA